MLETLVTCFQSARTHTHTHTHQGHTFKKDFAKNNKIIQISLETHPRGVGANFNGFDWLSLNLREFDWLMTTRWLTFNSRLFLLRVCACNKKGSAKMKRFCALALVWLFDCVCLFPVLVWLIVCLFVHLFDCFFLFACLFECLLLFAFVFSVSLFSHLLFLSVFTWFLVYFVDYVQILAIG